MKQIRFSKKPPEGNLGRATCYGQKSFMCMACNVWGPWWKRHEHVCKCPKVKQS